MVVAIPLSADEIRFVPLLTHCDGVTASSALSHEVLLRAVLANDT